MIIIFPFSCRISLLHVYRCSVYTIVGFTDGLVPVIEFFVNLRIPLTAQHGFSLGIEVPFQNHIPAVIIFPFF